MLHEKLVPSPARALALAAAIALPAATQAAPGYPYRVTELLPFAPGQGSGVASLINNRGLVCGSMAGPVQSFCWYRGTLTPLLPLPGDETAVALGLNDLNQVVGRSYGLDKPDHAVIFVGGQARPLAVASHPNSAAADINNLGQVVGALSDVPGDWYAFASSHGTVRQLGELGGPRHLGGASAINDLGQIVGAVSAPNTSPLAADTVAFLYQHGVMRALPTPAGYRSSAARINLLGQAVGVIQQIGGGDVSTWRAVLWQNGARRTLVDVPSEARGLNNLGQVVGATYEQEGGFLYTPGQGARNLNTLIDPASGYRIVYPQDINDLSQIVGYACKAALCGPVLLSPWYLPVATGGAAGDAGVMREGER
ncbi:hypothetical protein [uncultured Massilia sp.]|uniref:hypothetical protein n=1 Tax=uncultured Massilia sp. TaxID=169973 RepID=UPI0025D5DC44|nr:hypothetical protein [uncultured Massilia sp.]